MACSNPQQAQIKEATASGDNSVAVSAPHIVQYPRPPRNDSGRFVALGSVLGSILGRLANTGRINQAEAAEDTWRSLNDALRDRGAAGWTKSDEDRTSANINYANQDGRASNAVSLTGADRTAGLAFEADKLVPRFDILVTRADEEDTRADLLSACIDSLHEKLCAYAECGYKPDYQGIGLRARADADIAVAQKIEAVCTLADRYNTGVNADVACELHKGAAMATIGATAKAREDERQFMWRYKGDLYAKTVQQFEVHRNGRLANELNYTRTALDGYAGQQRARYQNAQFYESEAVNVYGRVASERATRSIEWNRDGGQMTAGAGQNYAWLAESLRRTAQLDGGGFTQLGVLIALLFDQFFNPCGTDNNCGC